MAAPRAGPGRPAGPNPIDELVTILDALVEDPEATFERIAIPWLHVLNRHPVQLANYEEVLQRIARWRSGRGTSERPWRAAARAARSYAAVGKRFLESSSAAMIGSAPTSLLPPRAAEALQEVDAIIVSPLVDSAHLEGPSDFYFGTLQERLSARGVSSLLVLRNASSNSWRKLQRPAFRAPPTARMFLPDVMSPARELGYFRRGLAAKRELREIAKRQHDPFFAEVARHAASRAVTGATIANYRLHDQILAICARLRPRMIFGLYEGHALERCIWKAARRVDPSVYCVGYQHTTVWPHSHALRKTLRRGGEYDPDLILTIGEITRRDLAASPGLRDLPLVTIGSHRFAALDGDPEGGKLRRVVLVVPEGLESECVHLFAAAIDCARARPDLRFILRMHPVLPFGTVRHRLGDVGLSNIEVSEGRPMQEDFARSGACLYRGSSTVLHAILAGLKPFYLFRSGEADLDPVHALTCWRERVGSAGELSRALTRYFDTDGPSLREWGEARAFCADYVREFDDRVLDALLQKAADQRDRMPRGSRARLHTETEEVKA